MSRMSSGVCLFVIAGLCIGCRPAEKSDEIFVNGKTRAQVSDEIEAEIKKLPESMDKDTVREYAWKAAERNAEIERLHKAKSATDDAKSQAAK